MSECGSLTGGTSASNAGDQNGIRLELQAKIFYFDIKDNERGWYLKLSEKRERSRWTVVVPPAACPWVIGLLDYFVENYSQGSDGWSNVQKELRVSNKVYFFHVEQGAKAGSSCLRFSECGGPHGKSSLLIPAETRTLTGWLRFKNAFIQVATLLLNAYNQRRVQLGIASSMDPSATTLQDLQLISVMPTPEMVAAIATETVIGRGSADVSVRCMDDGSYRIAVDNKQYFLDSGSNARGDFIRCTEVLGSDKESRKVIVLPRRVVPSFVRAIESLMQRNNWKDPASAGDADGMANTPQSSATLPRGLPPPAAPAKHAHGLKCSPFSGVGMPSDAALNRNLQGYSQQLPSDPQGAMLPELSSEFLGRQDYREVPVNMSHPAMGAAEASAPLDLLSRVADLLNVNGGTAGGMGMPYGGQGGGLGMLQGRWGNAAGGGTDLQQMLWQAQHGMPDALLQREQVQRDLLRQLMRGNSSGMSGSDGLPAAMGPGVGGMPLGANGSAAQLYRLLSQQQQQQQQQQQNAQNGNNPLSPWMSQ